MPLFGAFRTQNGTTIPTIPQNIVKTKSGTRAKPMAFRVALTSSLIYDITHHMI